MSVQAMAWVFQNARAQLGARLVLLAIANHADKDGRNSWASVAQLGDEAHLSARQVRRVLRELESTGEVVEIGVSPQRTHIYELPGMASGQSDPDILSGDDLSPGHMRPTRGTNRTDEGDTGVRRTKQQPSKGNRRTLSLVPEAETLCVLLADLVEANGSKRPNVTRTWLVEADRIYRLDRRPPDEVERVLRWSQADGFWRANVLSIPTFRRQYDRLRLAASRPTSRAPDRASEIFAEAQALREAGL